MSKVRDYKELSSTLKKIAMRLMADQELCKLLRYSDTNPLSHPDFDTKDVLNNEIRFMPLVGAESKEKSKIAMLFTGGGKDPDNRDIRNVSLQIFVYTPYSEWVISGDDLRIFLIMSKIEEDLDGKLVDGIGKLRSDDFELALTTDEMCAYRMGFSFDVFS